MPLGLAWEELRSLCQLDGGAFRINTLKQASRFCLRWARRHYENFLVASALLPAGTRSHVAHLYAFARLADDIADHPTASPHEKLTLLATLEDNFLRTLHSSSDSGNPVLTAFSHTIRTTGLPLTLLSRLLTAFRYDACFQPFETWHHLKWYCQHSANPIGEALLFLHNACHPLALCASNALCTALQVLNFWQDLSLDLPLQRLYLPLELLRRHHILDASVLWRNSAKLQACIEEVDDFVLQHLRHAEALCKYAHHPRLRWQALITLAAAYQLRKRLQEYGERILQHRPKLGLSDGVAILLRSWRYRSS